MRWALWSPGFLWRYFDRSWHRNKEWSRTQAVSWSWRDRGWLREDSYDLWGRIQKGDSHKEKNYRNLHRHFLRFLAQDSKIIRTTPKLFLKALLENVIWHLSPPFWSSPFLISNWSHWRNEHQLSEALMNFYFLWYKFPQHAWKERESTVQWQSR